MIIRNVFILIGSIFTLQAFGGECFDWNYTSKINGKLDKFHERLPNQAMKLSSKMWNCELSATSITDAPDHSEWKDLVCKSSNGAVVKTIYKCVYKTDKAEIVRGDGHWINLELNDDSLSMSISCHSSYLLKDMHLEKCTK